MRGSPLLRALLAFLIILSLGWPLWRLTHAADAAVAPDEVFAPAEAKAIGLQLAFTLVPKSVEVRHLGKVIWSDAAPTAEMERELPIAFPKEGVDLQFHVVWPDDAPLAAMRVRLTDPAGEQHERSVWGQGSADEVLTFP